MYLFYRVIEVVFPPVDADSNVDTTEFPVQELEESIDKKKKKPKQKVGFRDRKVSKCFSAITKYIIIIIIISDNRI